MQQSALVLVVQTCFAAVLLLTYHAPRQTQKLKEKLSREAAEVKRCQAEIKELRGGFEKERETAEALRAEAAKANASTRQAGHGQN